jgi:uncharacterized protein YvpB
MKRKKIDKLMKFLIILATFSLIGLTGYQILFPFFERKPGENLENKIVEVNKKEILKESFDLKVPFAPQAPFGMWDNLHNNACEEAALVMVHYFKKGEKLTKEKMEEEIQSLVNWQIKNWGTHKDLNLEELKELAEKYYGYSKIEVVKIKDINEIKKEVAKGNPVIVPAAGRLLNNPFYRRPGPYYHMLVIRGYKKDKIITNDPGTKRGEKYFYPEKIIFEAIHDWPGEGKDILTGEKKMLIIKD